MRKILSLITITLILLSLVACSAHNKTNYEWEQLEWPTYDNAKQIPIPKSTTADIGNCNDIRFDFYVANTTLEDYKAYVENCKSKGFTIEAVEQENRYYALNEGKYELTVQYYEGDIMYVEVVEHRCEIEIKLLHTSKDSADYYDIRVEIDGGWEDDSKKGEEAVTFDSLLKEGQHTLIVENDENNDINGRIDFVVTEDGEYFEFEITCSSNKIDITQITGNKPSVGDVGSTEQPTTKDEPLTEEDNKSNVDSYVNGEYFNFHPAGFAKNFDEASNNINGYTFYSKQKYNEDMLFIDEENIVFYEIQDVEDNYRTVGMYSFSKGNDQSVPVIDAYSENVAKGINILIENTDDVAPVVYATILSLNPTLTSTAEEELYNNIFDNIGNLDGVTYNSINYVLYKENGYPGYHYLVVTIVK